MARQPSLIPFAYRALTALLTVLVMVLLVAVTLLGMKVWSGEREQTAANDGAGANGTNSDIARTESASQASASQASASQAPPSQASASQAPPSQAPPSRDPASQDARPAPPLPSPVLPTDLDDVERRTIEVFRASAPRVVHIENLAVRADPLRRNVLAMPRGTVSGFIWDDAGHVVTNFHVIQDADAVRVTLADGSAWSASLVGVAADKDLAVLKIEAPSTLLSAIELGNSAELVVGQHVLAIGNPFGLDHTLSTGVISGLGREIMSAANRPIQGVIQTDAAINPGNSGGPLLDSRGRLIGVNTAIYSPTGASAGIGFAVPVDTIKVIVTQLIDHGRVVRPGLGVIVDEGDLARRGGIAGALVLAVQPGSSAARAGLVPTRRDVRSGAILLGDVIVALDGESIDDHLDLYRILDRKQIGDTIRLGIVRGQGRIEVRLALQAVED